MYEPTWFTAQAHVVYSITSSQSQHPIDAIYIPGLTFKRSNDGVHEVDAGPVPPAAGDEGLGREEHCQVHQDGGGGGQEVNGS